MSYITRDNDRSISLYWTTDKISGTPTNLNYYKGSADGTVDLQETNLDGTYLPLQQGVLGINVDTSTGYWYIIDTNPGSRTEQTGHWQQA